MGMVDTDKQNVILECVRQPEDIKTYRVFWINGGNGGKYCNIVWKFKINLKE